MLQLVVCATASPSSDALLYVYNIPYVCLLACVSMRAFECRIERVSESILVGEVSRRKTLFLQDSPTAQRGLKLAEIARAAIFCGPIQKSIRILNLEKVDRLAKLGSKARTSRELYSLQKLFSHSKRADARRAPWYRIWKQKNVIYMHLL